MGISTRNKNTRESNKQRGPWPHLIDRKGSLEKVFGMDAEELTKSKRVCGKNSRKWQLQCSLREGWRWHGASEWGDFTKANMARTQRVRQQWEREKATWARPCSVL